MKDCHFLTFSCYERRALLRDSHARSTFEQWLEKVRIWYAIRVYGYVVMPEHVHLLLSEPGHSTLAVAIQMLKQNVAREIGVPQGLPRFWHRRYYDFNVKTHEKQLEKLVYLHRNPVARGLAKAPEDWMWSSYRHYTCGEDGVVEIESERTALKRERAGILPVLKFRGEPV